MARLSADEVKKVARLANLSFDNEDLDAIAENLSGILDHIAKLQEVDTKGVEETSVALEAVNVFREDKVKSIFDTSKTFDNAPASERNHFAVPRIIE